MSPRGSRTAATLAALAAFGATLGACGGGVDGPHAGARGPAVRIVSGADVADTVDVALAAPLVLEVVDSAGNPAADALVLFTSPSLPAPAACTGIFACQPSSAVYTKPNLRTDAQGRASLPVGFGEVAGAARLAITVPALGVRDTARFTILPGRAARTTIAPHDTCVYLGTATPLRAAVVDRYGNPRPEAPTLVGLAATPVTGTSVGASAYGVYAVTAAAAGAAADTARVRVVPRGTIAALAGYAQSGPDTLVVFDLDGTQRARLSAGGLVNGITWAPDGSRLVFARTEAATGDRLYATTLTGTPAPLAPTRTAANEQRPAFSHDGRWLFFGASDYGAYSWRLWRANADGTGAQPVGGSVRATSGPIGTTLAPSADGSRVAYASGYSNAGGSPFSVVDVATGKATEYAGTFGAPRWSPHDDLIAYSAAIGQGLVTPAGVATQQFPTSYNGFADLALDWSPDARWLIARNRVGLELVDVTSGTRIPLPYADNFYQPAWKP